MAVVAVPRARAATPLPSVSVRGGSAPAAAPLACRAAAAAVADNRQELLEVNLVVTVHVNQRLRTSHNPQSEDWLGQNTF